MDEIIDDLRETPKYRFNNQFNFIWIIYGIIAMAGSIFKILHWPGGYGMIIIGFAGLSSHFLIHAIFKSKSLTFRICFSLLPVVLLFIIVVLFRFYLDFLPAYLTVFCTTFVVGFLLRK